MYFRFSDVAASNWASLRINFHALHSNYSIVRSTRQIYHLFRNLFAVKLTTSNHRDAQNMQCYLSTRRISLISNLESEFAHKYEEGSSLGETLFGHRVFSRFSHVMDTKHSH